MGAAGDRFAIPDGAEDVHDPIVDVDDVVRLLLSGRSVVLVGTVGAGKSVTVRRVAKILESDSADRSEGGDSAPSLSVIYPGSSEDLDDLAQRAGRAQGDRPRTILLIDDAHDLGLTVACGLAEAIRSGRVTALLVLETPDLESERPSAPAQRIILDLWTRGHADRFDLGTVSGEEAASILRGYCGGDLDQVTRDALVWQAHGSRWLLHEFGRAAREAFASNRDPLPRIRDASTWTRLGAALEAHLASFDDGHLETFALIDRLPGIEYDHLARLRPAHEIDALISSGYVHVEACHRRRMWANAALGRSASRVLGVGRTDSLLAEALALLSDADAGVWSEPIARILAESLLRGRTPPGRVDPALRRRALLSAARRSNDLGSPSLAAAFASAGWDSADPDIPILLELVSARVTLQDREAEKMIPSVIDGGPTRTRAWEISTLWERRGFGRAAIRLREALNAGTGASSDPRADIVQAEHLAESLLWNQARAAVDSARATSDSAQLWALLLQAQASGHLGDVVAARRALTRVEALLDDDPHPPIDTVDRLRARLSALATHLTLGEDSPSLHEVIAREALSAAKEGDERATGVAGVALALSAAMAGDTDGALRTLDAARSRFSPIRTDIGAAWVEVCIAQFLARHGRGREAREIVERVQALWNDAPVYLQHSCHAALSLIAGLESRPDEARREIRYALALTANAESPMLRTRDLYRALALGVADDDEADEIHALIEKTPAPLSASLGGSTLLTSRRPEQHDVREAFVRSLILKPANRGVRLRFRVTGVDGYDRLTRREIEVASLIAEGLPNREIAEHLYLSVRTVESHVYQARAKIGASSRRELGARVERWMRTRRRDDPARPGAEDDVGASALATDRDSAGGGRRWRDTTSARRP